MGIDSIVAPRDIKPSPVLLYLYSYRNIAGSLLALVGLGLFFAHIIGSFIWPFVVGGLYLIGALLAPGTPSYELTSNTFDPDSVRRVLDNQVSVARKRLPPELAQKVQAISDTITGILPHYKNFAPGSQDLFVVGQTATQYLPSALQSYLNLPPAYAATHRLPNGKTAAQNLSDQLDLLESRMEQVADAVLKKDSDALLANGRFLQDKFGASPLSLPTTN